jgi:hypothetical protein
VDRPQSFDVFEHREAWDLWVLDHGLPDLPSALRVGESVPIARWSGPVYGAVLSVSRDEDEDGEFVDANVVTYRRTPSGWEAASGEGGGSWYDDALVRPDLPPRLAAVPHFHHSSGEWSCAAAYGVAGVEAATVEVQVGGTVTTARMESPVGAFVVAADGTAPAVVRVRDTKGELLAEERFSPA